MTKWIPFPWGKTQASEEELIDVEGYVESLANKEGFIEQEDMIYIKPMDISSEAAVDDIIKEFRKGNIVVLDIGKMLETFPEDLYKRIGTIKKFCASSGGDLCRVSQTKLLILPEGIEVAYHRRCEPMNEEQD